MFIKILKDAKFSINGINILEFSEDQIIENPEQGIIDYLGENFEEVDIIVEDDDEDEDEFDLD